MLDAAAAAGVVPPRARTRPSAPTRTAHTGTLCTRAANSSCSGRGGEDRPHELAVGVGQLPEDPRVVSFQKLGELQANRRERHRLRYLEQREVVLAASVQQDVRDGVEIGPDTEAEGRNLGTHEPPYVASTLAAEPPFPRKGNPAVRRNSPSGRYGVGSSSSLGSTHRSSEVPLPPS